VQFPLLSSPLFVPLFMHTPSAPDYEDGDHNHALLTLSSTFSIFIPSPVHVYIAGAAFPLFALFSIPFIIAAAILIT
jgi:hypothetical protein